MGRAHHSHVLVWCEKGRTAWLRERGASYADLEENGIYLPVSRVSVEYRGGAAYDERVEIETRVEEVRSRTVTFGYRLSRVRNGERIARATTQLVCVDADGATRRLPGALRRLLMGEGRARSRSGRS